MESLVSQNTRLIERADHRLEEIETTSRKVKGINNSLKEMKKQMDNAVAGVDSLKPIASNIDVIKEQQEELKACFLYILNTNFR